MTLALHQELRGPDKAPGARFEVMPNAAHLANIEQPELVTRLIEGFLR